MKARRVTRGRLRPLVKAGGGKRKRGMTRRGKLTLSGVTILLSNSPRSLRKKKKRRCRGRRSLPLRPRRLPRSSTGPSRTAPSMASSTWRLTSPLSPPRCSSGSRSSTSRPRSRHASSHARLPPCDPRQRRRGTSTLWRWHMPASSRPWRRACGTRSISRVGLREAILWPRIAPMDSTMRRPRCMLWHLATLCGI